MSTRRGQPKHQNRYAWKPNAGHKINETEVGGRFRPLSEITGVCGRCKEQIEWKRRYGKYKPLSEPAKCQLCSKRSVRQAYHNLCTGCARDQNVCAKCRCQVQSLIGRDSSELELEKKMLEEAIKNARERDRRTLLRAVSLHHFSFQLNEKMNKGKSSNSGKKATEKINKVGELFPTSSLDDYAKSRRAGGESHDNDDENEEKEEEEAREEEDEGEGDEDERGDDSEEDSD